MNRSLLITNELYTPIKSTRSSFIIHTTEKSNLFDESDTSIILTRRQRQATTKESDIHRRRNIIYDSDEDEDDLEDCNNSDNKRHSGNTSITVNPAINDDILPPDISQITNFYTPQKDMEHSKEGQHSPVMENTPATTRIHSTGNTPFFTPISTLIDHDTTSHRYHTPLPTKTDTNSVNLLVDQLDKTIILSDDESEIESVPQKIVPTTKRDGRVYKCCTAGYCQPLPPRITQKWRDLTPLQFRRRREKLAAEFYRIFNQTIFDQLLPEDMPIVWCNKGRTTGGLCDLGIEKDDAGNVKAKPVIRLIEKVLDNADRLAEVLVHEMTHAATFIINRTCKARHGPIFRTCWLLLFFLRILIIHRNMHTYTYSVGRHSKSLDITRLICGKCHR
ncbi:hypothetical protein BDF22DRAFT_676908 [Syncephalis plumigaleata]|nr:hypothetical protein BDF22DRAFT_676908 [Syncephalis plumigaleata]